MKTLLLAATVGAMLASAAAAEAAVYEGKIKGEPDSTFEITVEREGGDKKVADMAWTGAPTRCDGMPPEPTSGSSGFTSGGRIHKDGSFKASLDASIVQNRIKGQLKPGGKAAGTFRTTYGMMTVCRTGNLDWVATR